MPRKSLALRAEEKQTGRIGISSVCQNCTLEVFLLGCILNSNFRCAMFHYVWRPSHSFTLFFFSLQGHQVKNAGSFEEADPEEHMLFMFEKTRTFLHYIWCFLLGFVKK